jgi:hypothetical protein
MGGIKMEPIVIKQNGEILAHHTTESCLSHYGQPVWVVEDEDPKPGPATWSQGDNIQELEILCVKAWWLIVRQPDGYLVGILWNDGDYYANLLETAGGKPCRDLEAGQMVRGAVRLDPDNPDDLGSVSVIA